ncbi:MAG: ATP-binding cassette domain-containing protein, partial [Mitsuokella sp.]
MTGALLEMRQIEKEFPGVRALSGVDFTLNAGEIHSLMGENGAGKSTLVKVLTGVYQKDGGTIRMNGREIAPRTPKEAQECGISTVYQEVNLCPNLTVAENIFIGREPKRYGWIDWRAVNARAQALLERLDVRIDVTRTLDHYSVALQQMIAIARAVDIEAKILILDEPTSSLDEQETERLFKIIRHLQKEGMGIIFISHFLEQVYTLCDHVTILRNGELVGAYETARLPRLELIAKMVGKEVGDVRTMGEAGEKSEPKEEVFLEAKAIGATGVLETVD